MSAVNVSIPTIDVVSWEQIAQEFRDSDLLLGNGFSMMLSPVFGYHSLFEIFLNSLSPVEAAMFRRFGTTNFEAILERLKYASEVNSILGLPVDPVNNASESLKKGLIVAVQQNHPKADDVDKAHLTKISQELDQFGNIFTLNYDALLYQIIMISVDRYNTKKCEHPYQDYFWNSVDEDYLAFMNSQAYKHYKHVYYLHGALFIFARETNTLKIRRTDGSDLLSRIETEIAHGHIPLFVSEGTSQEKELAIYRNYYLRFSNHYFRESRSKLVIYGVSFSSPDEHVVHSIRGSTAQLAIAVRTSGKSEVEIQQWCADASRKFPKTKIVFFDSSTLFKEP